MDRVSFDNVILALSEKCLKVSRRAEGVAFLKTARDLYHVERITYICIDIPSTRPRGVFSHCAYSDSEVLNFLSHYALHREIIDTAVAASSISNGVRIPLRQHCGESAVFDVALGTTPDDLGSLQAE